MNGLCQCGCGKPAPIAKQTNSRYGHVAGQPMSYIHGHHWRGKKRSGESRAKMSSAVRARWASLSPEERKRGPRPEDAKRNAAAALPRREKHWNWKGGRGVYGHGYVAVFVGFDHPMSNSKGYVAEHRLVVSEHLGRHLGLGEDVHHINGDKQDNRIENLRIVAHASHTVDRQSRIYAAAVRGLLAEGLTQPEIAKELHMSPETIARYAHL